MPFPGFLVVILGNMSHLPFTEFSCLHFGMPSLNHTQFSHPREKLGIGPRLLVTLAQFGGATCLF